MKRIAAQTDKLNEVLSLLWRLFNIRITFFNVQERELENLTAKPNSPYCRKRRQAASFAAKCRECDHRHLEIAKEQRDVLIYHCHQGLLEGIVPLYDKRGVYLGAIIFGQVRDRDADVIGEVPASYRRELAKLPLSSEREIHDIGLLLKWISESIIENEIIQRKNQNWAERLDDHIERNLAEHITLADLARVIGKSASFVSQNFASEFGRPPHQHIKRRKMEEARRLLEEGRAVHVVAEALGFYDAYHFSKVFKGYWGRPPVAFKRNV